MGAATGDRPDGVRNDRQAAPTVPRMALGAQLRRLRKAGGISLERAGEAIHASHTKISRMESGSTGFKLHDLVELCTLYGVTDHTERATLLGMARQANAPGWWHPYSDVIPYWFEAYLGLEQAASVIRSYEVQFVPGLLQCRDYARAVIELGHGGAPEHEVHRRVELRMRRQQILNRPRPPHLWVVIDEGALRRAVGGAATMFAQLQHLIDISDLPHVTVQVLPFHVGGHAAAGGPITLLRLPEPELPDVVYLEQLTIAQFPDRPAEIDYYLHIMNRLVIEAAPAQATPTILRRILKEL
jgi:transcriptional regulator with XRE-family HTH domain